MQTLFGCSESRQDFRIRRPPKLLKSAVWALAPVFRPKPGLAPKRLKLNCDKALVAVLRQFGHRVVFDQILRAAVVVGDGGVRHIDA